MPFERTAFGSEARNDHSFGVLRLVLRPDRAEFAFVDIEGHESDRGEGVEYVIVGGVALVASGSSCVTEDLDICYARSPANLAKLAKALAPFRATLRGAPADLPFVLDAMTFRSGLNFTLSTDACDLDLLGELPGVGLYEVAAHDARISS